ncbi:cytochrome P450 [Parafrankia sp. EAN1pec]|uniref:cytochrome P450 n=1 Tax=Parafrankia sp. (strain EAN1pec) TaxID=298653 RepID=UPI00005442A7|nr:cytochrome P450 [Frankia sp. EAN1pec]
MTTVTTETSDAAGDVYYDPYDFEIDADPYPVWRRMRDSVPLYYNAKYDFFAISRFDDVEKVMGDFETYRSGRGSVLEIIRSNIDFPPGNILFEDPPVHDIHRSILARVFTPRKMLAIEPKVREFCARSLDSLVAEGNFDFIADLGAQMPMRTIGMLLGIPEQDQEAIRDAVDEGLTLTEGAPKPLNEDPLARSEGMFADYLDWRARNPSDDLMTELITAEFEDETGTTRRLTRAEVLTYVNMLSSAGNETTTRLIGWTGKVLSDHPDQLRQVARDRSMVNQVIEEVLRFEAPSPVQARYVARDVEVHGQTVPEGSVMVLLNGSANRDERQFVNGDSFDIHRSISRHVSFGRGLHFCLGAALARLEGRVALDEVLKRWDRWEVDYDRAVQARTSTVRGWAKLPVTATPR